MSADRPDGRRVAAFDFDGTITRRDTLVPFLIRAAGPTRFARLSSQLGVAAARRTTDIRDRDNVKAELIRRVFAGRAAREAEELGRKYALGLRSLYRPAVLDRIDWHRREGHELVIVSASLEFYLRPVAEQLGFDHVIGVELEVDAAGRLTGEMARENVRAEQKAVRIREWLDGAAPTESWAYGNTSHDHALMDWSDHPYWLGKAAKVPPGAATL